MAFPFGESSFGATSLFASTIESSNQSGIFAAESARALVADLSVIAKFSKNETDVIRG